MSRTIDTDVDRSNPLIKDVSGSDIFRNPFFAIIDVSLLSLVRPVISGGWREVWHAPPGALDGSPGNLRAAKGKCVLR